MKHFTLAMILSACLPAGFAQDTEEGFQPLMNGTDLSGWVLVNTPPQTWTFEDGLLVCSGKPIGELRTEKMYQNFILELEWRHMVPRGNAGVFVWADDVTARGVPFHRGIEVQVLENAYGQSQHHTTHGDIFPIHGATMTPDNGRGGSRAFPTEERSKPSPEWNHYRITCKDGMITLAVNGKQVTSGRDCVPREGYICLESEGGVVHYRNVRIKELPGEELAAEQVAIQNRGYRSIYTGLDLSGWETDNEARWKANDWTLSFDAGDGVAGSAIATVEQFRDFGFLVDVKLKTADSEVTIWLRDNDEHAVEIDLNQISSIKAHLEAVDKWNRIEGRIVGKKLSLNVNGHDVDTSDITIHEPSAGSLSLSCFGSVDFSNIYVRETTD